MARRRCCCPGACYVFYDQFNRLTLGTDWTQVNGTWTLSGGQLVEGGTADSILITTAEVPADSAGEMDAFVQVYNYNVGDVFRLYVAWDTASEYYMVQVTYQGSDTWYVELCYKTSVLPGATATQLATVFGSGPDQYILIRGCIDSDGNFKGGVISASDEPAWITATGTPVGRKMGLGHDNTGGATFDEFYVIELRTEDIVCSQCWCHCNGNVPSKTLLATIWDATGRAACLNGDSGYLNWNWAAGASYWDGTIIHSGSGACVLPLKLICDATIDQDCPGVEWTLENTSGFCCTNLLGGPYPACAPITPDCDDSTCWPLDLVFGPFEMRDDDFGCDCCFAPMTYTDLITGECTDPNCLGYYYIHITDPDE